MNKWKFLAAGLVLVILILCMMTFLLNGKYRNLQIQVNRMDREHMDLKKDYDKLYNAYYSYDKKVLKLLEGNPNVYWAVDSSAYVVYNAEKNLALFSFYKEPRMEGEYFLWQYGVKGCLDPRMDTTLGMSNLSTSSCRVDTLKPNQFVMMDEACPLTEPVVGTKNPDTDMPDKILLSIKIR